MRAQANLLFVISAALFSALLVYTAVMLLNFAGPYFAGPRQDLQEMRAIQLSDTLISTKGRWANETGAGDDWESHTGSLVSAGLASSYHNLSAAKIESFANLTDGKMREMYGNDSVYFFCIREISSSDCSILASNNSAFQGKIVRRYAHYINRTVEVRAGVW
jgi:hypothetical protein